MSGAAVTARAGRGGGATPVRTRYAQDELDEVLARLPAHVGWDCSGVRASGAPVPWKWRDA